MRDHSRYSFIHIYKYVFFPPRDCHNVVAIGQQIKTGQSSVTPLAFTSYVIDYFCQQENGRLHAISCMYTHRK